MVVLGDDLDRKHISLQAGSAGEHIGHNPTGFEVDFGHGIQRSYMMLCRYEKLWMIKTDHLEALQG